MEHLTEKEGSLYIYSPTMVLMTAREGGSLNPQIVLKRLIISTYPLACN